MVLPKKYRRNVVYSSELYHHGIKGQKWGIRRYQNPDGTLTEEGKKRYSQSITEVIQNGHVKIPSEFSPTKYTEEVAMTVIDEEKLNLPDSVKTQYAKCLASMMVMPDGYVEAINQINDEVIKPTLKDALGDLYDTSSDTANVMSQIYSWGIFCNVYDEMK